MRTAFNTDRQSALTDKTRALFREILQDREQRAELLALLRSGSIDDRVEELLSRPQAAAYLGLRPTTLAVWAATGRYQLPFVRIGARVMYRRSDLNRFVAGRTVGAEEARA